MVVFRLCTNEMGKVRLPFGLDVQSTRNLTRAIRPAGAIATAAQAEYAGTRAETSMSAGHT